ncbi:MAG: CoA pyrophosphatase [Deltaproteobacteria bacterium]|nr:CoA pyrophosphatase [Deltaproteobacteria bacterium]
MCDYEAMAARLPPVRPPPEAVDADVAAVAAVIGPGPDLLFIRRTVQAGDPWSGQVAFPGGRAEAGDPDPVSVAVRETLEEVGLDLSSARLLGPLPVQVTLPHLPVRLAVHPFVFGLPQRVALCTSDEVARVLWLPLEDLLSGRGRGTLRWHWQGVGVDLPCVRLDGERLWGMTLLMVDDLLDRLRDVSGSPRR